MRAAHLLLCSVFVRLLWALFTTTYASPDEYWQGPEVAHGLVFGAGARTWEWWPGSRLRSYLHPFLLALGYAPLRFFYPAALPLRLLWLAPRLVSAAVAVAQDAAVWAHARALWGADAAAWAVAAQLCSWFSLFGGARAFGNSLQAALVAAACAAWDAAAAAAATPPRAAAVAAAAAARRRWWCGFCAGASAWLAVSAHATSAPLLVAFALVRGGGRPAPLAAAALGACCALLATQALDAALGEGAVTLSALLRPPPALAFLTANLGRGLDALSGTHPWHWYAWGGLPPAVGPLAPAVAAGLLAAARGKRAGAARPRTLAPAAGALALLLALSLAAHKEHRYLLPLGPAASLYAGLALGGSGGGGGAPPLRPPLPVLGAAAALGWGVAYHLAAVHQRGPVAAAEFVALAAAAAAAAARPLPSVHFLMPCHAAPLYAVLHAPLEARYLDCSPGAAAGGPLGAAPRAAVCAASGCCAGGAAHLPYLSESAAWTGGKGALLEALYGGGGCGLPRPCAGGGGGPPAEGRGAVPPARFAWAFGTPQCRAAMGAPPAADTALPCPTHAVLYDTDAQDPAAARWLRAGRYSLVASFPMGGWVQGDAHAVREGRGSPGEVGVWVHPCWGVQG
jgi:phosphatidylinositol glycan class B